jgi:transcriptional regulator with XRE-family HTH domain
MIVGERIRTVRKNKKLTRGELEKRCGIPKSSISRIENGHSAASIVQLEELAKGLEVPLHELFYDPAKGTPRLENLSACRTKDLHLVSSERQSGILSWVRAHLSRLH